MFWHLLYKIVSQKKTDIVVIYDFDLDIESEVITHVAVKYKDHFIDRRILQKVYAAVSQHED